MALERMRFFILFFPLSIYVKIIYACPHRPGKREIT